MMLRRHCYWLVSVPGQEVKRKRQNIDLEQNVGDDDHGIVQELN